MPYTAPQRFILELSIGGVTASAIECPCGSEYAFNLSPAVQVDFTAAVEPVVQGAGQRTGTLSLRGRSGVNPSNLATIATGTGENLITVAEGDGIAAFEALRTFIANFYELQAASQSVWVQNAAKRPRMIWRALAQGDNAYIDEIRLSPMNRVGSSNNSYEYTLEARILGLAKSAPYRTLSNTPTTSIPLAEGSVMSSASAAVAPIAPKTAFAATSASVAGFTPNRNLVEMARDLPGDMLFFRQTVLSYLDQVRDFEAIALANINLGLGVPRDAVRNIATFSDQATATIYNLWDAISPTALRERAQAFRDEFNRTADSIALNAKVLLGLAGSKLGQPESGQTLTLAGGDSSTGAQACAMYRVLAGEDLASFAARFRVAPLIILQLNQMPNPWTTQDGQPLCAGTPLLVPLSLPSAFERTPDGDGADVYGTDYLWDRKANDYVTEGSEPTDFASVTGIPNLKQGLLTRYSKPQGSNQVRPLMGVPGAIGDVNSPELGALQSAQCVSQASADQRVKRVKRVLVLQAGNVFQASIGVVPIAGPGFSVSV